MAKKPDYDSIYGIERDIDEMDAEEMAGYLALIRNNIALLDLHEPRSFTSEAYEEWADCHEWLEDIEDDILDRFDELGIEE